MLKIFFNFLVFVVRSIEMPIISYKNSEIFSGFFPVYFYLSNKPLHTHFIPFLQLLIIIGTQTPFSDTCMLTKHGQLSEYFRLNDFKIQY